MDSFDDTTWDMLDCNFIDVASSSDFNWVNQGSVGPSINIDFSQNASVLMNHDYAEKKCTAKRGRHSCIKPGAKACRERIRREKLNDRFLDLSSMLEPGRAAKTDKLAILDDAIKILNQLRTENEEFMEENKKLLDEIKTLKVEKHELREEKMTLKTEKDKVEHQLKAMSSSPTSGGFMSPHPSPTPGGFMSPHPSPTPGGFMSPHPSVYHPGMNKMTLVPSYSMYPMWHYLPPSVSDTSHDHELRPPAA